MANAITNITQEFSKPYLTIAEFKNAPTALDWSTLVSGGNLAAQNAELSNAIIRASSYIDQFCSMRQFASLYVENQRIRFSADGTLKIHPQNWPIVALTDLKFGSTTTNLTTVPDCSVAWIEDQSIIFPASGASLSYSTSGPLSFGYVGGSGANVYSTYSYVAGYVNSITTALASIGASSLTVDSGAGIIAGQTLRIYDGEFAENVTVANNYVFGSTTVPLSTPLTSSHNAGAALSGLPAAIKQAAILLTGAFLKVRGDTSMVMGVGSNPSASVEGTQRVGSDIALADVLLKPFRRMR